MATARHVVVSIAGCRAHLVACAGQSFREAAKLTKGLACKPQTTGFRVWCSLIREKCPLEKPDNKKKVPGEHKLKARGVTGMSRRPMSQGCDVPTDVPVSNQLRELLVNGLHTTRTHHSIPSSERGVMNMLPM